MKIVNRAQFLALPAGTVFSKFERHILGDLAIKDATVAGCDFYAQPIAEAVDAHDGSDFADKLESGIAGADVPLDLDCPVRDGQADDDQLFAVWSAEDVAALVARLQRAMADVARADAM